jgi:hypothetical protein
MPWREDLVEQLDWLAQEVDEQGGDAWVMRVGELSEAEHRRAVDEINNERAAEYAEIRADALEFLARPRKRAGSRDEQGSRLWETRELQALQRRFRKVRDRDHFEAPGRSEAAAAIDRCLRSRPGVGSGRAWLGDSHHEVGV